MELRLEDAKGLGKFLETNICYFSRGHDLSSDNYILDDNACNGILSVRRAKRKSRKRSKTHSTMNSMRRIDARKNNLFFRN